MPIDYKRYPPNWKTEIVPAVIARANDCCELCGLKNKITVWAVKMRVKDEKGRYKLRSVWFRVFADAAREADYNSAYFKPVKVILTVAHLDHDETNHDVQIDRLKAMCQICHLRYDAVEKYQRSLRPKQVPV